MIMPNDNYYCRVKLMINYQTDQYSDAYISLPEHAIFIKLISLDRTVNADLTYS